MSKGESPSTLPVQTNISDGRPESGMQKILATIAVGLALNLPSTIFGQSTEPPVHPRDLMALRIGGAVRNGGLSHVDPTMTISEALAMAGGPARQGQGAKVWVFRDGEIITTIRGGGTLIKDSPIRSGDQLFVAWVSAVPERSWISQNLGVLGVTLTGAVGIAIALNR